MKLSKCLTLAALALSMVSVSAYAQTSQTYRFGEGQTAVQPGNAHPAPPAQPHPQVQPTQPAQPQPQPAPKKKHTPKHHRHYHHRVPAQDAYSHN
jgi:outer membrane biosynthesis protein TonB